MTDHPTTLTSAFALGHNIDGFWVQEAVVDGAAPQRDVEAMRALIAAHGSDRWRVEPLVVRPTFTTWRAQASSHFAAHLRRVTDPEWAEYQRLREKFGVTP